MNKEISKYIIHPGITVKEAMKQLDLSQGKVLFLAEENQKLIGSLTDGDIRRWILSVGDLDSKVENTCNLQPFSVVKGYDNEFVKKEILKEKYSAIPVLDFEGKILDILFWDEMFDESELQRKVKLLDCHVVIMAGGQ